MESNTLIETQSETTDVQAQLLARWVDQHADALYRFALRRVSDRHAIEDLMQETFLVAIRSHGSFRGESNVRTWLIAILRLKIIDHYRKESKIREAESAQAAEVRTTEGRSSRLERWNCAPDNSLECEEFWFVFHACISKLPETLSRAYLLRELDGCSPQEVCQMLNISGKNLAVRMFRARSALRDCLDKNWFSTE
jgi:RNA polymerase sigma-70 factor (ECF subfamily)